MRRTRRWFVRGLAVAPFATHAAAQGPFINHFKIPDEAARLAAAGRLDRLSPVLQAAFTPGPGDLPIPPPGEDDWLADRPDEGQTFAAFTRDRQHRPTAARRTIAVKPLGKLADTVPLATLLDFTARFFGLPVKQRLSTTLTRLGARSRRNDGHKQYYTQHILDALIPLVPHDAYCMIGVTMDDLYPDPAWNYVFGEARFHDRVGVYSFARYDPAFHGEHRGPGADKLILRRCLKLMAHEVGHMFAIHHCIHYACVMNGSNNLAETDRNPLHLCPVCLRKLHDSINFDITARERTLADFFNSHGLTPEAEYHEAKLARLLAATG